MLSLFFQIMIANNELGVIGDTRWVVGWGLDVGVQSSIFNLENLKFEDSLKFSFDWKFWAMNLKGKDESGHRTPNKEPVLLI